MIETTTLVWIAVIHWLAIVLVLSGRRSGGGTASLGSIEKKLIELEESMNGLREYLYEIDTQFDDERRLLTELYSDKSGLSFAGKEHLELTKRKEEEGYRTLNSAFSDGGFRAPRK